MTAKGGSDLDKFAALIVDELHAVEDRLNGRIDKVEIEISEIKDELRGMHHEMRAINRQLDLLEEKIGWMSGFAKEIDTLRSRVAVLEKQILARA